MQDLWICFYHQAKYCIWICKELQPEHRKAINLLNDTTDSDYRFYGIELKTFQLEGEKVYAFHLATEPDFDEKYLQNLKDKKNPKVVYLNQFWEKVKAKLPWELQKCFHIQYSGKSYANLVFDNYSFWISTNFSSTKRKARVSIITNEDDTFRQLTQIVEGEHFKKCYTHELRKEDGKRNPNWHFYIDEIDYKERPEEVIDWLANSACQMYRALVNTEQSFHALRKHKGTNNV